MTQLTKLLGISMKLAGAIGNTFFITFFALGKDFLRLWIPAQNITLIFHLCIIVLIGDIIVIAVRPLYYVYVLTDNLKKVFGITILMGIFNVTLMLLLIPHTSLGPYIVVGSTMVLNLSIYLWTTPRLASRYLNLRKNIFLPIVCRHIFVCMTGTAVFYFVASMLVCDTWISFLASGVLVSLAAFIFCILGEFGIDRLRELKYGFVMK